MSNRIPFQPSADPASVVVPGVDPALPPAVQIEQIDQLITARLASIDNNLAQAHQTITSEILPAIQRLAKNTQPVRDAARFWRSFFEMAATVRVPTEADYTASETDAEGEEAERSANDTITAAHSHLEADRTADSSVLPLHDNPFLPLPGSDGSSHSFAGVVSSTPMRGPEDMSSISTDAPSWTPSHGSLMGPGMTAPFTVEDSIQSIPPPNKGAAGSYGSQRGLNNPLFMNLTTSTSSESSAFHPPTISDTTQSSIAEEIPADLFKPQRSDKGKAKAGTKDLRHHVLKKAATPRLSRYNPFHPVDSSASESDSMQPPPKWNGIVDLSSSASLSSGRIDLPKLADINFSSSSESAPSRGPSDSEPVKPSLMSQPARRPAPTGLPPSSIRFPPPNPDLLRVVATPSKKAADLLVQDLLAGLGIEDSPDGGTPMSPAAHRRRVVSVQAGPRPSMLRAMQNPLLKDDDDGYMYDDGEDSFDNDETGEPLYAPIGPALASGAGDDSFESEMSSFDGGVRQSMTPGNIDMGDTTDFGDGGAAGPGLEEDTLFGPRGNPRTRGRGFVLDNDTMSTYNHGGRLVDAMPSQASPTPQGGAYAPLDRTRR